MTPEERELVSGLFDRLAALENSPRDGDAERAIIEGLRRAPNAAYALVQTALVQDEALKRANARIQELEAGLDAGGAARPTGFLDGMRETLLGRREGARGGSVPSVRPGVMAGAAAAPAYAAPQVQYATGGSFLGTAASAAAGVIGGALLLDGIRSMMGHGHGATMADPALGASREHSSPWDSGSGNPGDLARQAGIDDVSGAAHRGHGNEQAYADDSGGRQGFFDDSGSGQDASYDQADQDDQGDQDAADFDNSGDFGGGDFSGGGDAA
jgi:hypothetical protein